MIPALHSIGRVAGKHGFSGEISIALGKGQKPEIIKKGNFLFIEFDGKGVPFLVESYKASVCVVKLSTVNCIEDATELEGRTVLIEGTDASSAIAVSEILGFSVYNNTQAIGIIQSIEDYPAGEMLVLTNDHKNIMIPWVETWLKEADFKKKILFMELPEGLLDL